MRQDRQDRSLIDSMVGHQVVEYMAGPRINDDLLDQVVNQGRVLGGRPEAKTAAYHLRGISTYGIEVVPTTEAGVEVFMPWDAVLAIYVPNVHSQQSGE